MNFPDDRIRVPGIREEWINAGGKSFVIQVCGVSSEFGKTGTLSIFVWWICQR
jgi:hypothetical protein